eukprot:3124403-Amphidinium_carterae.1
MQQQNTQKASKTKISSDYGLGLVGSLGLEVGPGRSFLDAPEIENLKACVRLNERVRPLCTHTEPQTANKQRAIPKQSHRAKQQTSSSIVQLRPTQSHQAQGCTIPAFQ